MPIIRITIDLDTGATQVEPAPIDAGPAPSTPFDQQGGKPGPAPTPPPHTEATSQ
jgi:hypothetical protein